MPHRVRASAQLQSLLRYEPNHYLSTENTILLLDQVLPHLYLT